MFQSCTIYIFFATATTSELLKNIQTEYSTIKFAVYLYTGTRNMIINGVTYVLF